MADETSPLDEARLEEIRESVDNINQRGQYSGAVSPSEVIYAHDVSVLLAAYDRLRTREAAATEIVRDVATEDTLAYEGDAGDDYRCVFCGGHFDWGDGEQHSIPTREQLSDVPRALVHTPDCPVTKARALLSEGE